ncbi:Xaa-Pro aminopeptidase [Halarchaeum acidiphilum MH1-52-1]|uniref:Xaa-Pro aminopeptidase n=1 Tax=Halarchaeum acidiphilum MH1-52-1 TaxID=1261545 RepID=U2YCV3_9EURY|nr:Xaa-Pro peptidase family protein [Halarchaeum acidiphilum]GAD51456.1 Xaa-Pro aminopeptidase [Halarchaeum acidiphilum MH1-52-1]
MDDERDYAALDAFLREAGRDGYLLHASADLADQYYLSGFDAPDPFVTLYTPETTALLVSGLEYGRARSESRADAVRRYADYDYHGLASEHGRDEAFRRVVARFLDEFDAADVATNARFPLGVADDLRARDVAVTPDRDDHVGDARAAKTATEVEHVREAQTANEASMRAAETLIREASVADGVLRYDGGALTAERVKEEIEVTLLRHGCSLDETIVACGADAAEPHNRGSGPLRANEPIVIDIFPRSKTTKYHADMTRTFVKGEPSDAAREFYDVTRGAFDAAFEALEPGATGADVHAAACEVYEDAGYPTLRSDPGTETGYIHSTGHGVGLDVHEGPRLSEGADGELVPGHVITIEPGLYDPDVGGVRIEDIAVVTEDGYEDLTDYPVEFVVE